MNEWNARQWHTQTIYVRYYRSHTFAFHTCTEICVHSVLYTWFRFNRSLMTLAGARMTWNNFESSTCKSTGNLKPMLRYDLVLVHSFIPFNHSSVSWLGHLMSRSKTHTRSHMHALNGREAMFVAHLISPKATHSAHRYGNWLPVQLLASVSNWISCVSACVFVCVRVCVFGVHTHLAVDWFLDTRFFTWKSSTTKPMCAHACTINKVHFTKNKIDDIMSRLHCLPLPQKFRQLSEALAWKWNA